MITQRPTNIAMLSVHTSPIAPLGGKKTGGMNVYVRELSTHLARCQINVDVFTRRQHRDAPPITVIPGTGVRVIQIDAGPTHYISSNDHLPLLDTFTQEVLTFAEHEQRCYDVLHSHYWLSGLVAEKLQQQWVHHPPIIQMFHTLGRMKNRIATDTVNAASQARIEAEQHIMATADRLIAATPAERLQMMWLYGADMHRITTISPGVDTDLFHPHPKSAARRELGTPEDQFVALFVGRIEPLKGIDTLITASAQLKDHPRYEDLAVHIIGGDRADLTDPNSELHALDQLARQLDASDTVYFLGAQPQDKLPLHYAAADVVVMPSHYESFGMVALEAMACGTPVIASEVGGLAYLIEDGVTGFHVPYRSPEAITEHLQRLMEQPDLHQKLSREAAMFAHTKGWPAIASDIYDTYTQVFNVPAA